MDYDYGEEENDDDYSDEDDYLDGEGEEVEEEEDYDDGEDYEGWVDAGHHEGDAGIKSLEEVSWG